LEDAFCPQRLGRPGQVERLLRLLLHSRRGRPIGEALEGRVSPGYPFLIDQIKDFFVAQ
jgi:hypothetical protein